MRKYLPRRFLPAKISSLKVNSVILHQRIFMILNQNFFLELPRMQCAMTLKYLTVEIHHMIFNEIG